MAGGDRIYTYIPASIDSVQVARADTASFDLDIDIMFAERLDIKLLLMELGPGLGALDLETSELIGVRHDDCGGFERLV